MIVESLFGIVLALAQVQDSETLRFAYSSEQGFDTSCGLSTLSCLMHTYWDEPVNEGSLAQELFTSKEALLEYTISFADMTKLLKGHGFVCAAYKMNYEQLSAAVAKYAPVILHYDKPLGHFALALATNERGIVTADPAEGTVAMEKERFISKWSGYVLLAALPSRKLNDAALGAAVESVLGRERLLDRASLAAAGALRW